MTDYLEQTFSKDELMELYLNVIEFGPPSTAITAAAEHYFGRTPAELTSESACFSRRSSPLPSATAPCERTAKSRTGWMRVPSILMQIAHHYGRITDAELAEAEKEPIVFWRGGERPAPRPPVRVADAIDGDTEDDEHRAARSMHPRRRRPTEESRGRGARRRRGAAVRCTRSRGRLPRLRSDG